MFTHEKHINIYFLFLYMSMLKIYFFYFTSKTKTFINYFFITERQYLLKDFKNEKKSDIVVNIGIPGKGKCGEIILMFYNKTFDTNTESKYQGK